VSLQWTTTSLVSALQMLSEIGNFNSEILHYKTKYTFINNKIKIYKAVGCKSVFS
jgi:hypothetical protein